MKSAAYWTATALIALETLAGGVVDLVHGPAAIVTGPSTLSAVTSLGYPVYFLTILGVAKLLGGATLLGPGLPRLKEWAYAGIVFELIGASASLLARGYGVGDVATPLLLAAVAMASWALRPPGRTLGQPATAPQMPTGDDPAAVEAWPSAANAPPSQQ